MDLRYGTKRHHETQQMPEELIGSFYHMFLLVSKFYLPGGEGCEQSLIFGFSGFLDTI